jgi:hypothetical protein
MNDVRFTASEIQLLTELLNKEAVSIIWDINAFYFDTEDATYKLECCDEQSAGSDEQYDELFFGKLYKLSKRVRFEANREKYWYKIISHNVKILEIELVETIQYFPGDKLFDKHELPVNTDGLNKLCLGLIVTTTVGIIPAILMPSNYGFMWLERYGLYERSEVETILVNDVGKYQIQKMSRTSD